MTEHLRAEPPSLSSAGHEIQKPTEVHVSGEQFLMMKSIMRGNPQLMATPTGLVSMFPGLGSKKPLVQKKVK
jgi:hypothetical protein